MTDATAAGGSLERPGEEVRTGADASALQVLAARADAQAMHTRTGRWVVGALACTLLLTACQTSVDAAGRPGAQDAPAAAETPAAAHPSSAGARPPASSPSTGPSASAGPSATADATTPGPTSSSSPTPAASGAAAKGTALAALALLPVKGRAPMTGYTRDQFGPAWKDVDRNGCDTRNDVLARDLVDIARRDSCIVATGTLHDPYSGTTIAFVRGQATSAKVQIDHVVALADAWQKGAQGWDEARRTAFANDPLELLAVDGSVNQRKGAGDAATWLPPSKAYRCQYVARQVAVKYTYGLWVTRAEHDAIARILAACPGQSLPRGSAVPPVGKAAASAGGSAAAAAVASGGASGTTADKAAGASGTDSSGTAGTATSSGKSSSSATSSGKSSSSATSSGATSSTGGSSAAVTYKNCAAAWAAGAAPVRRGDPGYSAKLDRDGDGVGCEYRP